MDDSKPHDEAARRAAREAKSAAWREIRVPAAVFLICLMAVISFNVWYTGWWSSKQDARWCATIDLLTSQPVAKPSNPKANPSREATYELYADFLTLRGELGCGK